jgi:2-(1,2-epoxy-1,2-dihydrophenyl)acetyl-CoA isomerase
MPEEVLLEISQGVGYITLNRPEKLNAVNRALSTGLQEKLDICAGDATVRSVYLTGSGRAFSSGQDLTEFNGRLPDFEKVLAEHYTPIVTRLRNIPKPVVCAVNGIAAGAGANIALCCDIVVAVETASFVQAFSRIGLIPDCGGTYFLPRLIGLQKATALAMLGEKIDAATAEKMGMIFRVFEEGIFSTASRAIAETLAKMPTQALILTRQAMAISFNNTLEQQLLLEGKLQAQAGHTSDFAEGAMAFLQKRAPVFTGK